MHLSEWIESENRPLGWFSPEEGKLYSDTVAQHPKGVVVELGTYLGRSLSFIIHSDATIYVVDLWDTRVCPPDPVTYPPINLGLFMVNLQRMKAAPDNVRVLQLDSVLAAKLFDRGSVSVVMVDTLHTEDRTLREIEAWWSKVKCGGGMLFHDYGADEPRWGVRSAVDRCLGKPSTVRGNLALVKKNLGELKKLER